MSDPVTNVEIEDVLSSIRRLVSTEDREVSRRDGDTEAWGDPEPAADPAVSRDAGANRLVLTPSLRIDNSRSEAEDIPEPDHEVQETRPDGSDSQDVWPGQPSETGSVDAAQDQRDGEVDAVAHEIDEPKIDEVETTESATAETETAESGADEPASEGADVDHALQSRIAELEEVIAARQENWEPDGTSDDAYSGGRVEPLPWVDTTDPDEPSPDFSPASHGDVWAVDEPSDTASAGEARTDTSSTDDAQDPVASVLLDDEGFAADDDVLDDYSNADDGELNLAAAPEDILDEDALRELVAAIVREELQGALGERITRNVRKLVRREIHRAMAIQDLE